MGGGVIGYLRPDQFLDHLTVIKITLGLYYNEQQRPDFLESDLKSSSK